MASKKFTVTSHSGETLGNFRRYLLPSMLSMMLMAVYTFTATFVFGQKLGAVALSAMGNCTPVLTFTYAFGFLFGTDGLWVAVPVSEIITSILSFLLFRKSR